MRHFLILLKHEVRMLLISPATYIASFLFLTLMGLLYWIILNEMANSALEELPHVEFFKGFWIPTFFVVPLLTMRSIAGERSSGTLDTLLTTPTSRISVVLSKFTGAYLFYLLLWFMTLGYPLIVDKFFPVAAASGRLLETAPIIGSFAFITVSGILFISIGIFSSSITRSQLVAGMLSFTALFIIIIGGQQLSTLEHPDSGLIVYLREIVEYLQIFNHLDDFSRGIIDTRPIIYYTSLGALLLGLASLVIKAKA
ncbi:MAG: ABC transporter permease subunit [Puniceicoccaceae bacterium]|nr:ABC transporter permease subunit [Puniceicoccaceae bacterium]